MAKRNMIVQLLYSPTIASQSSTAPESKFSAASSLGIPGLTIDASYAPVPLRALKPRTPSTDPNDLRGALELNLAPESTTYIVRAEIEEGDVTRVRAQPGVAGVFIDP